MAENPLRIAVARPENAGAFAEHVVAHTAESGVDGSPVFSLSRFFDGLEVRRHAAERWERPLSEANWGRAWLLWSKDRVIGHAELRGGRVPVELHRASLGMGLSRAWVGRGHGTALFQAALRWATEQTKLAWIDLGVLGSNLPARRFYAKMGFIETHVRRDAFRIEGVGPVDDHQMSLLIRR